jgi:hypothetical protein
MDDFPCKARQEQKVGVFPADGLDRLQIKTLKKLING